MKDTFKFDKHLSKARELLSTAGISSEATLELLLLLAYAITTNPTHDSEQRKVALLRIANELEAETKIDLDFSSSIKRVAPVFIEELYHVLQKAFDQDVIKSQNLFELIVAEIPKTSTYSYNTFTPCEISQLISGGIKKDSAETFYDPSCGSGGLLFSLISDLEQKPQKVIGNAQSINDYKLAHLRILLSGLGMQDISLQRGEVFPDMPIMDCIVSNPPYGRISQRKDFDKGEFTKAAASSKSEVVILAQILDHLSDRGTAAVVVPSGVLFASGTTQVLRKKMIEANILEAVVQLPPGIFYNTGVSTAILFFNKLKSKDAVLILDLTGHGIKAKNRIVLEKDLVEKTSQGIVKFRNCEQAGLEIENALIVTRDRISENNYSFGYQIYTDDLRISEPTFRPSSELLRECQEIEHRLKAIQQKF